MSSILLKFFFKQVQAEHTAAKSLSVQTMARSKLVGEIGGLIKTQGAALLKMARIGTSREIRREGEKGLQWGPDVSKGVRKGEERK